MEKRLLIIDDNKEIVEIVTNILSDLFDKIDGVYNVEEAEKVLSENTYSLIFLDINLEGRNGAEIVKFLIDAPDNPNKNVPFIIISGIITPQFIERHQKRFAGILMKPFIHDDVRMLVEEILEKSSEEVLPEPAPEADQAGELPYLRCELPFPIPLLEQRVNKIMDQVKKNSKLKQLFSQMQIDRTADNYVLAHIGMLINISTAICVEMEWNTDKTLEKFVYAAYLHDMAIADRADLARINTFEALELAKESLSSRDYQLVFEHTNMAANTIEENPEIPSDVAIIVRQHHELPKQTGFPTKCGYQKITPLSVIFIIAHDLTEFILANPKWTMDDYIKKSRSKFQGSHFTKIIRSLAEMK